MTLNGQQRGISRRQLLRTSGSGLAIASAIGIAPRYLTRPAHAAELAPGMTGGPTGFPGCERYQYNGRHVRRPRDRGDQETQGGRKSA